ncbi:glycosyltransferase 87 family protein [Actinoplanes sp. NPDC049802]|uniref:glycosyltransferase 87 family protein n=1 Tax=Actinoplanes sp. NPDC049802 TaxID=3154742 RepID=UPI0033DDF1D3
MPARKRGTHSAARVRLGVVALGVLLTPAIITLYLQRYGLSTLAVEHAAVRGWLAGGDLYAYRAPGNQAGAALPPALALLLAPLTLLPLRAAGWLLALTGVAALLLTTLAVTGPVARRHGRRRLPFMLVAAALALLAEPVRAAIGQGRPELLIVALLAADLLALRRAARARHRILTTLPGPRRRSHPDRTPLWVPLLSRTSRRPHAGPSSLDRPPRGFLRWSHATAGMGRWLPRSARLGLGPRFGPGREAAFPRTTDLGPGAVRSGDPGSGRDRRPRWLAGSFRSASALGTDQGRLRRAWATGSWAGVGTGVAGALCAVPLLFIVYLLLTKQRRAAMTALLTAAVVTLAALAAAPEETLSWYGTVMWELDRPAPVSAPDNQSLAGVMARLYGFPAPPVLVWFSFGMLLLAVGLIRARSAHADGDEVAAFTLIGLTGAITGPVSTSAETLWLLPAILVLADTGLRRRLGARPPRSRRFTGIAFLAAALLVYLSLLAAPSWSLAWNIPAFALILLVNTLPWRHGAPALPVPRPGAASRPAAIPLPRGG